MLRSRRFVFTEEDIMEILCGSDSDEDENRFNLDDEDVNFLEEDGEVGTEVIIDDILSTPSTSTNMAASVCVEPIAEVSLDKNVKFIWRSARNYQSPNYVSPTVEYGEVKIPAALEEEVPSVFQVFSEVCDFEELLKLIIEQTHIYAQQKGVAFSTNVQELKAFFGIILGMTIHKLPDIRLYWSTLPIYHVGFIANVMPRKRFEMIRSMLHFANNNTQVSRDDPTYDRAFKIRPIINHINVAFDKALSNTKTQSIDEHMVKFKGKNSMKQYMKDKPISWGFKLWCRCDAETGYLFQTDIYTGKREKRQVGIGESVVLQMSEVLANKGIEIYFDNFFSSPILFHKLMEKGIKACGTVRVNRSHMPKFNPDSTFKRGDFSSFQSNGVTVVKWMDNRAVHIASNFLDPNETITVKRRQAGNPNKISVQCPAIIKKYNTGMGGVDLMDQKKVNFISFRNFSNFFCFSVLL